MDADTPFPPVSDALVAALRAAFPDRLPPLDTPEREVHALIGEQRVIAFLIEQNRQQNEESNVLRR